MILKAAIIHEVLLLLLLFQNFGKERKLFIALRTVLN